MQGLCGPVDILFALRLGFPGSFSAAKEACQ
jgi:hypothetical protein